MQAQGFSLIEIIIVISIIALFASFTYPNYRDSITRARRIDGQTALIDLANRMENYYTKYQSYQGATLGLGSDKDVLASNHSPQNWYILAIINQSDSEFSLQAIPRGAQALDDKACQILSLNSFGRKGIAEQCW